MRRSRWLGLAYLGLRIASGIVLVATIVVAARFGWYSPGFRIHMTARILIVAASSALLTAIIATFKRFTAVELTVILVSISIIGMLLIPAIAGHNGEPSSRYLLW